MKTKILIMLTALFLTACGQSAANKNSLTNRTMAANFVNQNVAPPSNQTMAIPENSTAIDKSKTKTFDGTGAVTSINLEIGSVKLDHDEIKGVMPAMQGMEFYVSDKKILDNLKVGDKVDFVLEDNAGAERIVSIKRK